MNRNVCDVMNCFLIVDSRTISWRMNEKSWSCRRGNDTKSGTFWLKEHNWICGQCNERVSFCINIRFCMFECGVTSVLDYDTEIWTFLYLLQKHRLSSLNNHFKGSQFLFFIKAGKGIYFSNACLLKWFDFFSHKGLLATSNRP